MKSGSKKTIEKIMAVLGIVGTFYLYCGSTLISKYLFTILNITGVILFSIEKRLYMVLMYLVMILFSVYGFFK